MTQTTQCPQRKQRTVATPDGRVLAVEEAGHPDGLPAVLADKITQVIKAADKGAAYLEATELAGFASDEAKRLFGRDPGLSAATREDYLTPWSAAKAEKRFLARFKALTSL